MARPKGGLGHGIEALFEQNAADTGSGIQTLRITDIE